MGTVRIYHRDELTLQLHSLNVDRYRLVNPDGSTPRMVGGWHRVVAVGGGAFSVTVRAKDPLGVSRAIKFMLDDSDRNHDSNEYHLATRELQLINEQPYKHVLSPFDFGAIECERGSISYYVSYYISGFTLSALNDVLTPLRATIDNNLRAALRGMMLAIINDILAALIELHATSIVHLDVKPQNVMIYSQSGWRASIAPDDLRAHIEGRALNAFVVNDVSAKSVEPSLQGRTVLRWTPYYFPPLLDSLKYEHADGAIDRAALAVHGRTIDLYSVGRTLEALLLDRLRRQSPYVRSSATLEKSEPEKEAFWKTVFDDDHAVLEKLIDRLLSLTSGFGTAYRAKKHFAALALTEPTSISDSEGLMTTVSTGEARLRTFLCHASEDKPRVRDLYERLKASGVDVWIDEESLLPGEDWRNAIAKAVRSSHVVVVCLSKAAITKRGYLQKEIRLALEVADEQPEDTIFMVPVRLEDCDIPPQLSRWQVANLSTPEGYPRLLRSLRTHAEELKLALGKA